MEKKLFNFNGRLAQFQKMPGDQNEFWKTRWSEKDIKESLEAYRNGKLDDFEKIFTAFLPRALPVLEAGCGIGQLVMGLAHRSYQAEGVDSDIETILRINQVFPDLNVYAGDVYHLDAPDGKYGGYISIGVFEHNPQGPLEGLCEARRVLHPTGVAFISVPYLNQARKKWSLHAPAAHSPDLGNGMQFYQYYFSKEEFEGFLLEAGFEIVKILPYAVYSGLTRDFLIGRWLHARKFFLWNIERTVTAWCRRAPDWACWRWAHMLMFVCKKRA